jgi:hypothetical protein
MASWAVASAPGAVTVSIPRAPSVTLHEPVIVTVTIDNTLEEPVKIDLGPDRKGNYRWLLTGSNGKHTAGRPFFKGVDAISAPGRITVQPGQRYVQDLLLNEWFDFEEPGVFTLQMRVDAPLRTESGTVLEPFVVTTPVEILPRDESILRGRLERLAKAAVSRGAQGMESALALMAVSDPIAVPYMREVLRETTMADWIIIPKLAHVPGDAVKALLDECVMSEDEDRTSMARDALRRRNQKARDR